MVRRFIQHQEIGLHDEEAGEVGPHDPAATEGACRFVHIAIAKGESAQDALGLHLQGVSIQFGKAGQGLVMHRVLITGMLALEASELLHSR